MQLVGEKIVNGHELYVIPEEDLRELVTHELITKLAKYIIDNMDELPIEYKKETVNDPFHYEKHSISVNIISDDELSRLRQL